MIRKPIQRILYTATLILCAQIAIAQSPQYPPTTQVAKDFRALLRRPKIAASPSFTTIRNDSIQVDKGFIYTEANEKVPMLIYKPVIAGQNKFPVVIWLHGTGGNKDAADTRSFFTKLAKRGIMGVAIDARYHGERVPGGAHGGREYTEAAYQAYKNTDKPHQQYPFLYDTAYDLWRLVDYLITRPDVRADRIGMGGISMGGMETWLAAAIDTRVHATVLGIAAQSFKWSLENNQWQGRAGTIQAAHLKAARDMGDSVLNQANVKAVWDKIIPGITEEFDFPSMVRLLAPRPVLILSKDKDLNNPFPGAQIGFASATQAYKAARAEDKLQIEVQKNLGHVFNAKDFELTLEFFSKYLLE